MPVIVLDNRNRCGIICGSPYANSNYRRSREEAALSCSMRSLPRGPRAAFREKGLFEEES